MSYNSDIEYFMNRILGANNIPDLYSPDNIHKDNESKSVTMAWLAAGVNMDNLEITTDEQPGSDLVKFSFEYKAPIGNDFTEDHFTFNVSSVNYDRWDYDVKDGVIYLTLFEKAKAEPKMKRVEKGCLNVAALDHCYDSVSADKYMKEYCF